MPAAPKYAELQWQHDQDVAAHPYPHAAHPSPPHRRTSCASPSRGSYMHRIPPVGETGRKATGVHDREVAEK